MARSGCSVAVVCVALFAATPACAQQNSDNTLAAQTVTVCTVHGEEREVPLNDPEGLCDPGQPVYVVYSLDTLTDIPPPKVPHQPSQPSTEGGRD